MFEIACLAIPQRSPTVAFFISVSIWSVWFGASVGHEVEDNACLSSNSSAAICVEKKWPSDQGTALIQARKLTEKKKAGSGFHVKYTLTRGIEYWCGTYGGQAKCQWADIMVPNNIDPPASGWPAMILVYGNGQKKTHMEWIGKRFIEYDSDNSVVCFNPAYHTKRDKGAHDIKHSVQYLASESVVKEYNIDKKKITLYGYSLGGGIVASILLTAPDVSQLLDKAVLVAPYVDNYRHLQKVPTDTSAFPPMLFVHCNPDWSCSYTKSQQLFNAIQINGATSAEMVTCPPAWNMGHKAPGANDEQKAWFNEVVMDFKIGASTMAPVPTPKPTAESTPGPTPKPTAKPTPKPIPESSEPSLPCKRWCATHAADWEEKCTYEGCRGCAAC